MNAECCITVVCDHSRTAASMEEVLGPDNRGVPSGQSLRMSRAGRAVTFELEGPSFTSLQPAVASILSDAALFQEVWLLSRGQGARAGKRKRIAGP